MALERFEALAGPQTVIVPGEGKPGWRELLKEQREYLAEMEKAVREAIASGKARRATDIPLWTHDSRGCPFVSRCPRATSICKEQMPGPTPLGNGHMARCHHIDG